MSPRDEFTIQLSTVSSVGAKIGTVGSGSRNPIAFEEGEIAISKHVGKIMVAWMNNNFIQLPTLKSTSRAERLACVGFELTVI